jgi:heat shock protein HspQ
MFFGEKFVPAEREVEMAQGMRVGTLVQHRRYRYRGVVVGGDPCCLAEEDWYQGNSTQPSRQQPWYHVLVHGSADTTYVAAENLEEDTASEPVNNPLVKKFFAGFHQGRYYRTAFN